jgi:branched-chain amino acid transport system ATP-binding protein
VSALLDVTGLTAGYGGVAVLHEVDLTVRAGTICAVLGANGAGKTTLLRTLSGLVRPTAGRIIFDGAELRDVPVPQLVHRGLAHVPEGRGVIAELTVDENLRLGGLWRSGRSALRQAVDQMYELFEPLAQRRTYPGHLLSGGERQLLALARALVGRPRLLLLDEPSLGLAPRLVEQIFDILQRIRADGTTVLLVEQNAAMALDLADRAYVLETGTIKLAGTGRELAQNEDVRRAYLGVA